jgi:hypothetical protein
MLVNAAPADHPKPETFQADHKLLGDVVAYYNELGRGRIRAKWCDRLGGFCIASMNGADLTKLGRLRSINIVPLLRPLRCSQGVPNLAEEK